MNSCSARRGRVQHHALRPVLAADAGPQRVVAIEGDHFERRRPRWRGSCARWPWPAPRKIPACRARGPVRRACGSWHLRHRIERLHLRRRVIRWTAGSSATPSRSSRTMTSEPAACSGAAGRSPESGEPENGAAACGPPPPAAARRSSMPAGPPQPILEPHQRDVEAAAIAREQPAGSSNCWKSWL